MNTILLTGIGNALVDIEAQVTEEELQSFGVSKGAMTLTDAAVQSSMLVQLGDRTLHRSSGGSAANTIIAFAQFGGSASYCSLLGNDHFGAFYAKEFSELNIHLEADMITGSPTGTCLVLITPDSERTLNTTLGANVDFNPRNINEELIKRSEWIYIEGYKLTDDNGAEAADMAAFYAAKHRRNIAVSCSDGFIVDVFGDRLRSLLKSASLVFCNEREACALADEESADQAFAALSSRHKNVVVTKGAEGSLIAWNGHSVSIPAYTIQPVDATGAGDMFAGAFLYGALHRYHPEHAGRLASYASAQVVGQFGARLKTSHIDVRDLILSSATAAS